MILSNPNTSRIDYLDAVRSFALLLGVVFHASLSFMPIFIGWAVMDITTSETVIPFMMISHSFRMELFFLIAGFFCHMTFHKQGFLNFLKSKLIRVALPFVIAWFLLRPLIVSGWMMGAESMRGDVNVLSGLNSGIESLETLPAGIFVGTHLWFLYYLLIIILSVVIVRFSIALFQPLNLAITRRADFLMNWLCVSKWSILVIAIPTAGCMWFMNGWNVDTPDKSLIPLPAVYILYSMFFIFGWLLHRQTKLMAVFGQLSWFKFALCLSAVISTIYLSKFEMSFSDVNYRYYKVGFVYSYSVMMWSLVSLCLGVFKRLVKQGNKFTTYLADASYWIYLIHLPIVVWLQIAFAELPIFWFVKLILICTLTLTFSLILYDLVVRNTLVGKILNGKKKPRVLFAKSSTSPVILR